MRAWPLLLLALPAVAQAGPSDATCGPFTVPLPGPWSCQLGLQGVAAWSAGVRVAAHPDLGSVSAATEVAVAGDGPGYRVQCATQGSTVIVTVCRPCEGGQPTGNVSAKVRVGSYVDPAELCTASAEGALASPLAIGVWSAWLTPG